MGVEKGRKLVKNERYRGRAKEGTCLLVNEKIERNVKEWREVLSNLMRMKIRMTLGCEKCVSVAAYGPHEDKYKWRNGEERDNFWESLRECMKGSRADENVVPLGDLNARAGDVDMDVVIGRFGVPGVSDCGDRLIKICSELGLLIGDICFKKRRIHGKE